MPHTPFLRFVSQINIFVFKSNNLTSPLSYPAATTLCYELWAFPKLKNILINFIPYCPTIRYNI
jgi:hypothetical protein